MILILEKAPPKKEVPMDIFKSISNIFNEDDMGQKELLEEREQLKKKFSAQLKEQLFMTDEEIKVVISVIDEYNQKRDKVKEGFNPEDHSRQQAETMFKKLNILQDEMEVELKEIIRTIMQEKLKLARELKKRREENNPS